MTKQRIIVHCSATPPSMDIGAEKIREWHVDQNGWRDIGYNIIIKRDGEVQGGRDVDNDGDFYEESGAHAKGFNADSIGICLIGGIDEDGQPDANFTFKQYISLQAVHDDIQARYGQHQLLEVCGHRDLPGVGKACPSFNVKEFFN